MMALEELKRDMQRNKHLLEHNHYNEDDVVYSYDSYHMNDDLIESANDAKKLILKIIRDMFKYVDGFNKDFNDLQNNNLDNHDLMEMFLAEFEKEGFNITEKELSYILNILIQFSDSVLFTHIDEE